MEPEDGRQLGMVHILLCHSQSKCFAGSTAEAYRKVGVPRQKRLMPWRDILACACTVCVASEAKSKKIAIALNKTAKSADRS